MVLIAALLVALPSVARAEIYFDRAQWEAAASQWIGSGWEEAVITRNDGEEVTSLGPVSGVTISPSSGTTVAEIGVSVPSFGMPRWEEGDRVLLLGGGGMLLFSRCVRAFGCDNSWQNPTGNFNTPGFWGFVNVPSRGVGLPPGVAVGGIVVGYGQPVPIPGAVWLLGSGLVGLIGLKSKKN